MDELRLTSVSMSGLLQAFSGIVCGFYLDGPAWDGLLGMQLSIFAGLVKRIVFYGCEIYADQLRNGDNYTDLKPVYAICLLEGRLWPDSAKVHHAFRLEDRDSGRILEGTLEFHTLELGWNNLTEEELGTASELDRWLFWLLHAHQYDPETLDRLFPQPPFRQATDTITRIAKITEDKAM